MKNCNTTKDICPSSKMCPPCDSWLKDFNKRQENQERQRNSRDISQNRNRQLESPRSQSSGEANQTNSVHAVAPPDSALAPPVIDYANLLATYNQLKESSSESPLLLNMYAIMLNSHYARQAETARFQSELDKTNFRLEAIEAKIGNCDEVAERLGLVIRYLQFPVPGFTDLALVKQLFTEIGFPGLDANRDVIKAVRKLPAKPNPNIPKENVVGSVLVEMRNEECRTIVMRNKQLLMYHPNPNIKSISITNMQSRELMTAVNMGNNIIQRIPGCEGMFITSNGQVREGHSRQYNTRNANYRNRPTFNHNVNYQPAQYQYQQPSVQQIPQFHHQQQPVGVNYQQNSTSFSSQCNNTGGQPPAKSTSVSQVHVSQQGSNQDNATFNIMSQHPPGPSGLQAPVHTLPSGRDTSDSD